MRIDKKIAIIGSGKMGGALAAGFARSGVIDASNLILCDVNEDAARALAEKIGSATTAPSASDAARGADIVLIAVKPKTVEQALGQIKTDAKKDLLVISIAAGWTVKMLQDALFEKARVIRVMPNSPALVGEGASAVARGDFASDADMADAKALLGSVGTVVEVDNSLMDAVTGLSGSGPAYVYLMIEAMIEGGVREGLPYDAARLLAAQTALGAAKMALESEENIAQLRANVTTPGGTTISGVAALEKYGARYAFMEAVAEATKKSRDMSKK